MGNKNSGPRPTPTKLKVLRGSTRKDRLNPHEPQIEPAGDSFDATPLELGGALVAIAEWARVVPLLRKVGLVSELERGALIALCQQWSRYLAARINPSIGDADKALANCLKLWQEFGFTPSGRSRIIALKKPEPPAPAKWAGML